jgi:hypothetical protein
MLYGPDYSDVMSPVQTAVALTPSEFAYPSMAGDFSSIASDAQLTDYGLGYSPVFLSGFEPATTFNSATNASPQEVLTSTTPETPVSDFGAVNYPFIAAPPIRRNSQPTNSRSLVGATGDMSFIDTGVDVIRNLGRAVGNIRASQNIIQNERNSASSSPRVPGSSTVTLDPKMLGLAALAGLGIYLLVK